MFKNNQFKKFIPEYKLTKKKYNFYMQSFRDVGSGFMVALLFALLADKTFEIYKFFVGLAMALSLWYIGSNLTERS